MKNDYRLFIASLIKLTKLDDFKIIINFYNFINHTALFSKDFKLYQLKLQWAIDTIKATEYIGSLDIDEAKKLLYKQGISNEALAKIVQTKNLDLNNFPFKNIQDLLNYIENTEVIFWQLLISLTQENITETEKPLIRYVAQNFAIVNLILQLHINEKRNVYVMIFSEDLTTNKTEQQLKHVQQHNIKTLITIVEHNLRLCKNHKKKSRVIKKLTLLNHISTYFMELIKQNQNYTQQETKLPKRLYLKIIISLLTFLYKS